jgi:2-polyprenyl-6-methoxyphenol hydroxylase-like FAD-dependent oxidoreductase
MPKNLDPFVLIAGGGPTGITAALELRRFGIPVRIIDEKEGPDGTSRAVGIQARTLEELELRGLASELVRLGQHATGGQIYGEGKLLVHVDFTRIPSTYNYLLFLSQNDTDRILREALEAEGAAIEWGVKMIAFGQDSSGVTATLEHIDGSIEDIRPAYVIDAEGAHSIIRSTLGLEFKGKTLDESFVLGDVHISGDLSNSNFHIFSSPQGFLGLFPMGGSHYRLVAGNPTNASQSSTPTPEEPQAIPTPEELQAIYDQRSHIPARLHQLTWSSFFHINSRMVKNLRVGRIFLAGDAAHIHSPAGAQGMNTGIQDAMNLGWKLALVILGTAPESLLDTYEQDRLPVMRSIVHRTEALTEVIGGHSILRNFFIHVAPLFANADFVQDNATANISQIALNYRNSPLSEDLFGDGNLVAGDRIPDLAICVASTGAPVALSGVKAAPSEPPAVFPAAQIEPPVARAVPLDAQAHASIEPIVPTEAESDQLVLVPSTGPQELSAAPGGSGTQIPAAASDAQGESKTIFSLLNPSRFTLLLANFADSTAVRAKLSQSNSLYPQLPWTEIPWLQIIDIYEIAPPAGEAGKPFTERFGVKPSITLVRPDAYIGFRGSESSAEAFTKYCSKWFAPAVQKQAA